MTWKATARSCTACGKPEAFPTDTRYGRRHDCSGCGCWAWGDGEFRDGAGHREFAARSAAARTIETRKAIRGPIWE